MIVALDVNLATLEGTSHINAIRHAAQDAVGLEDLHRRAASASSLPFWRRQHMEARHTR